MRKVYQKERNRVSKMVGEKKKSDGPSGCPHYRLP